MNLLIRTFQIGLVLITLVILPATAWSAPEVDISIKAEKDIVIEINGEKVEKRIVAEQVLPGEVIIYSINYHNTGDTEAENVAIIDPIPEGTVYIPGSATD